MYTANVSEKCTSTCLTSPLYCQSANGNRLHLTRNTLDDCTNNTLVSGVSDSLGATRTQSLIISIETAGLVAGISIAESPSPNRTNREDDCLAPTIKHDKWSQASISNVLLRALVIHEQHRQETERGFALVKRCEGLVRSFGDFFRSEINSVSSRYYDCESLFVLFFAYQVIYEIEENYLANMDHLIED